MTSGAFVLPTCANSVRMSDRGSWGPPCWCQPSVSQPAVRSGGLGSSQPSGTAFHVTSTRSATGLHPGLARCRHGRWASGGGQGRIAVQHATAFPVFVGVMRGADKQVMANANRAGGRS